MSGTLSGKSAIVTGANSGLGLEIVRALTDRGAKVQMACRNLQKAEKAAQDIRQANPNAEIEVDQLDLSDLQNVKAFADSTWDTIDFLVNNAGLMAIDEARTAQGVEMQYGVNHLGHFYLTALLLPKMIEVPGSRIANMASMGHRAAKGEPDPFIHHPYKRWQAYFHSKLANLLFTSELQRKLTAANAKTIAITAHPGGSRTDLGSEGSSLSNRITSLLALGVAQPAELGARPMVHALTADDVQGGDFFGPKFIVRGATPVKERPSAMARDNERAAALWQQSVEISKVDPLS